MLPLFPYSSLLACLHQPSETPTLSLLYAVLALESTNQSKFYCSVYLASIFLLIHGKTCIYTEYILFYKCYFCPGTLLGNEQEALHYLQVLGWLTEQVTPDCRHPHHSSLQDDDDDDSGSEDDALNQHDNNHETQVEFNYQLISYILEIMIYFYIILYLLAFFSD